MSFDELLSRADDHTLQQLVGSSNVRLLNLLDDNLSIPSELRRICLQLHTPAEMLRDAQIRKQLFGLLPRPTAEYLNDVLEVSSTDPYAELLDLKLRRNSAQEGKVFRFFGVCPPVEIDKEHLEVSECQPGYGLFDHQRIAFRKVTEYLNSDRRRVLLHMPTGSGKTRTALHSVVSTLKESEPKLVVWLAYSEELCSQAADEFEKAWSMMGDRPIKLYRYWGEAELDEIDSIRDGFMVAGLSKLYNRAKRDHNFVATLADRSSLVVIDEAHQAIADTYRFLLEYLVERDLDTGLLGLSATPGRTWNEPEKDEELANFFHRQKVTLSVPGYENPIDYLVDEGYLAKSNFRNLPYSNYNLDNRTLRNLESSLEIPASVLQKLAEDEKRNLLILNSVEDMIRSHQKMLLFAAAVEHSQLLATVLSARGKVRAESVTANTPNAERDRIIREYKDPESDLGVLCNYGVLTTGFDAPRTSAAVIARPTKSLVLYSQMVGRATRGPKAGGNKESEIRTIADTALPGFGDMATAFNNWEDVWDD